MKLFEANWGGILSRPIWYPKDMFDEEGLVEVVVPEEGVLDEIGDVWDPGKQSMT